MSKDTMLEEMRLNDEISVKRNWLIFIGFIVLAIIGVGAVIFSLLELFQIANKMSGQAGFVHLFWFNVVNLVLICYVVMFK